MYVSECLWWCNNCERQKAEETEPRSQINLSSRLSATRYSLSRVESRRFLQFESRVVKSVGKSAPCCTTHPLSRATLATLFLVKTFAHTRLRNSKLRIWRAPEHQVKNTLNHISHFQLN
ncbi:uncharacterized protein Dsimw501_GD27955 [Drosophila simulans]|uniref:Uncharacterized protein n=1 Tax=Drosophila simulans TaxID=7240 RepID=A0A0J9TNW4_DROSI|nr:uncharacterized protein Dsimw501_GD27955 [Drosophila simulans]